MASMANSYALLLGEDNPAVSVSAKASAKKKKGKGKKGQPETSVPNEPAEIGDRTPDSVSEPFKAPSTAVPKGKVTRAPSVSEASPSEASREADVSSEEAALVLEQLACSPDLPGLWREWLQQVRLM
jgi:hypothetical protein